MRHTARYCVNLTSKNIRKARNAMRMTVSLLLAAMLFGIMGAASAEDWGQDFDKALKEAKESGKPVLVDFSGSDWCGWCVKLEKEVFSKDEFKEFAKKNLVCLLVDFPRKKEQSAELKKKNKELSEKYKIEGFPTVLLLDATGKELDRTGYQEGGPTAYVKYLKEAIEKNFKTGKKEDVKAGNGSEKKPAQPTK